MTNAEKCLLLSDAMGEGSEWMHDNDVFEDVIALSKQLGLYKMSDYRQQKEEVVRLHKLGWSISEIMYEVGLSSGTVRKVVKEYEGVEG
ncbi:MULTISPECIES: helix-turn-helix domain-containing protein [Jeotgalibaca]|uniref:helix-turn-helix domain-containing protein n=2 Tax=Carnobacteriaceae TaxID=186828 RepID=UPI0035A0F207